MTSLNEFITGTALMKMSFEPLTMLTKFLPATGLVLLSGMPGAGKTELLIQQAAEIASKKKRVLFFCNEGGPFNFQHRLKAYCRNNEQILSNIIYESRHWPNFSKPDDHDMPFLRLVINKFKADVIFFDSGPDAFEAENEAETMKEPMRKIYNVTQSCKVCLVFSWHPAKGLMPSSVYSARGSTTIPGKADLVYDLAMYDKKRVLYCHKNRLDCPGLYQGQKWSINVTSSEKGKELHFADVQEVKEARIEEQRNRLSLVLSQLEQGNEYSATQILTILMQTFAGDIKEGTAKSYLRSWVQKGLLILTQPSKGRSPAIYRRQ